MYSYLYRSRGTALLLIVTLTLLLLVANGAPLVVGHWLHPSRGYDTQWPVDGGYCCRDGQRLLGKSKTWQGVVASLLFTVAVVGLLQFPLLMAALLALLAMAGDMMSSFIKRRFSFRSGVTAPGLDQLPESLLPMLGVALFLPLSTPQVLLPVLLFILIHIVVTECLALLHWHPKLNA